MVFTSVTFLFYFLPLTLAAFYAAPRAWRQGVLLAASLIFYAWGEPAFLLALLASIVFNHFIGLRIENEGARSHRALAIGVVGNLLLLTAVKYTNFITENLASVVPGLPVTEIPLPLGVSFFTFQSIAYLIDISRGEHPAQRSLKTTGVYIAMFPQLVAGPIVRYVEVKADLLRNYVSLDDVWAGIKLFMIGFAQKVLIANTVAAPVDEIYALKPETITPVLGWIAFTCYPLQILFDFAGYSLMAIGLGRMFGFRFPPKFNFPYIATSVTEFWRRWHMTLSRWFRDYLYIPLGGNRVSTFKVYRNLLIVFIATGIWHGAAWTFILWGLWHGAFLTIERAGLGKILDASPRFVGSFYTLTAVCFGWVLFRGETMEEVFAVWKAVLFLQEGQGFALPWQMYLTNDVILAMIVGVVLCVPWKWEHWFEPVPALRTGLLFSFFTLSMFSVAAGSYNPFIYFRF